MRQGTQRRMNMWTRPISQAALWLAIMAIVSPASALPQDELVAKIQAAGYSQVSDIKSTAEGITDFLTANVLAACKSRSGPRPIGLRPSPSCALAAVLECSTWCGGTSLPVGHSFLFCG